MSSLLTLITSLFFSKLVYSTFTEFSCLFPCDKAIGGSAVGRSRNLVRSITAIMTFPKQVNSIHVVGTLSVCTVWQIHKRGSNKLYFSTLCLHFLRQLKKFGFRHTILARCYHSVIESILCFGVSIWFGVTVSCNKACLERIVRQPPV